MSTINEQDFRIGARSLGFRRAKVAGFVRYERVSFAQGQMELRLEYRSSFVVVQRDGGTVHFCNSLQETWRVLASVLLEDR